MNLFAYGGNNPVNTIDPTGHAFMFVTAAIGEVIGAVAGGIIAAKKGKSVLKGALIGAAVSGLVGLGAGAASGALLAGSATASTAAVMSGAGALAAGTTGSGGLAVGTRNISKVVNSGGNQAAVNRIANNAAKGRVGETISGIVKNTSRIPALASNAAYRIPDGLTKTVLSEVKNYSGTLSYTAQLRDFVAYAQVNGLEMHLYTNATLSGPLQQLVNSGIIKLFPLG